MRAPPSAFGCARSPAGLPRRRRQQLWLCLQLQLGRSYPSRMRTLFRLPPSLPLALPAALSIRGAPPIRPPPPPLRFWRAAGASAGARRFTRMTTAKARLDLEAEAARNAAKSIQLSTIAKALLA